MKEFKNQWVRSGSGVPYFKYNVKEDKGVRCYEVEEKKFGLVLGTWQSTALMPRMACGNTGQ